MKGEGKSTQILCLKMGDRSLLVYEKFSRRIAKKLESLKYSAGVLSGLILEVEWKHFKTF